MQETGFDPGIRMLWNLLALVWCLVSVSVWRRLMSSCQLMFLGVRILEWGAIAFSAIAWMPMQLGRQAQNRWRRGESDLGSR